MQPHLASMQTRINKASLYRSTEHLKDKVTCAIQMNGSMDRFTIAKMDSTTFSSPHRQRFFFFFFSQEDYVEWSWRTWKG